MTTLTLLPPTPNDQTENEIVAALEGCEYFKGIHDKEKYARDLMKVYTGKLDIPKEIIKAKIWLDSNPRRRKKNYKSFLSNWMSRCTGWMSEKQNSTRGFKLDDTGYKPTKKPSN